MQRLELKPGSLVEQGRCGRILDQREVSPGIFLLEEPLAENHERNHKRNDYQEHDADAHQLLSPDGRVTRPHIRNHNGPRAAALAHEPGRAVAVKGSVSVDTDAAVLALVSEVAACAFIDVFLTSAKLTKRQRLKKENTKSNFETRKNTASQRTLIILVQTGNTGTLKKDRAKFHV